MAIPSFGDDGFLPPGIHTAALHEMSVRFAPGGVYRAELTARLESVVAAAMRCPTAKRVLLWGSYVTIKAEPGDLDYSVVVSVDHARTEIGEADRRYLIPFEARRHFNADPAFLIVRDYPLEYYIERLDFMCRRHDGRPRGIVEISLRGEMAGGVV
jgi:hypothetical protein